MVGTGLNSSSKLCSKERTKCDFPLSTNIEVCRCFKSYIHRTHKTHNELLFNMFPYFIEINTSGKRNQFTEKTFLDLELCEIKALKRRSNELYNSTGNVLRVSCQINKCYISHSTTVIVNINLIEYSR